MVVSLNEKKFFLFETGSAFLLHKIDKGKNILSRNVKLHSITLHVITRDITIRKHIFLSR